MRVALFAYSRRGCATARQVQGCLAGAQVRAWAPERLAEPGFGPLNKGVYGEAFRQDRALIFVGACGIAVREIAPYVRDKRTDPAVVCLDEAGTFVIPLLSGHLGGANALARTLAEKLGATAVITTATDVRGKFSVDAWAAERNCAISSMALAKAVSARILEADVPLCGEFPMASPLPGGVVPGDAGDLGIFIGIHRKRPFARTLALIPRIVHLGLGCRRGTSADAIAQAVEDALDRAGIDIRAVRVAATIDRKADEPGLLEYCARMGWPLECHSARKLAAVEGSFTASAFVEQTVGVDNVCERAAMVGARELIMRKTAGGGVTVAAAAEYWEADFGKGTGSGHRPR